VVDNKLAAMGGLDACYGRWDTHNHPLADVHPTEFYKSLFPGQGELSGNSPLDPSKLIRVDYNNSRIMDFQTVQKFTSNALAIQDAARMRELLRLYYHYIC
jgi:phospholipase D1/2